MVMNIYLIFKKLAKNSSELHIKPIENILLIFTILDIYIVNINNIFIGNKYRI